MRGEFRVIQNPAYFQFGTDAVLLADFAGVVDAERVCDLGTGTGILPLLIAARAPWAAIDAVEIQWELCDIAQRNFSLNHLEERAVLYEMDLKNAPDCLGERRYDCVVCNPPYFKRGTHVGNESEIVRNARHERLCSLSGIIKSASRLLKHGGRLCMVHQTARTAEIISVLRENDLTPKRLRAVHYSIDHSAKIALWEAYKGGGEGITWMPPLILRDENGLETAELRRIYGEK